MKCPRSTLDSTLKDAHLETELIKLLGLLQEGRRSNEASTVVGLELSRSYGDHQLVIVMGRSCAYTVQSYFGFVDKPTYACLGPIKVIIRAVEYLAAHQGEKWTTEYCVQYDMLARLLAIDSVRAVDFYLKKKRLSVDFPANVRVRTPMLRMVVKRNVGPV